MRTKNQPLGKSVRQGVKQTKPGETTSEPSRTPAPASPGHSPSGGASILVVDDNEAGRYSLVRLLRQAGHDVMEAGTGQECLATVARCKTDLILLDIRLPDVSGLEVCRRLKANPATTGIPVIQISALLTGSEHRVAGLESGADAYLSAPYDSREVLAHVNGLLRAHQAEERLRQAVELNPQLPWTATPDGLIEDFSPRWLKLVNISREAARGEGWLQVQHPEDLPRMRASWAKAFGSGEPLDLEHRVRTAEGTFRWMHSRAYPHRAADSSIIRWYGFTEDVQDRVEADLARKRAEDGLRESRERLRLAAQAARLFAFEWNPVTDVVRREGDAPSILGVPFQEETGASFFSRVHPEDRERFVTLVRSLRPGNDSYKTTYRVLRPGTDEAVLEESGRAAFDESGRFVRLIGMTADVTQRHRVEQALRQSEDRLRFALENSHTGAWDLDLVEHTAFRSPDHDRIFGYQEPHPNWTYEVFLEHVLPEDRARVDVSFRHALASGTDWSFECRIRRVDGEIRWIRAAGRHRSGTAGKPRRMSGVVQDITEHKLAEAALRESEERLRLAKTAGQIGIHDYNPVTGALVWDERLREMWGLGPNDPLNYEVFIAGVHPDDQEALNAAVKRALDPAGDGTFCLQYRLIRGRKTRWIAATGRTTFERGIAVRLIGTAHDITQQKEFQTELERLVAERTAKLQELVGELEHFSYTITHDMRAPLRAMRGFAEMISQYLTDCPNPQVNDFLRRISVAADRMDNLITDALNYNRAVRQELPLEPVNVGELLRGMLDTYPELQPSKARVRLEGEMPSVMGNQAALTQCFSNLLDNATKFVAPGQKPDIRVWSEPRGGWLRIWVEDKGLGIPETMLPRIFDMFSRGHTNFEGTGIGLALVRKVVDRMGGKVGVQSEEGKGSRFWLELKGAPEIPRSGVGA